MFSKIHKDKINDYFNKYPELQEIQDSLITVNDKIILPRLFYKKFPFDDLILHNESNNSFPRYNFKFIGKLRENQEPIIEALRKSYIEKKELSGLLIAVCGIGKTAMSVYITTQLRYKTCVLVDNLTIGQEWIKNFKMLTNIHESKIGIVGGGKYEIHKPIVIATVQGIVSKLRKDFEKTRKDFFDIGFVIFDESHASSAAQKFSQASYAFRTKNILGLTATPHLYGINQVLFDNTFGEILYEYKTYEMTPEIYFIHFNSKLEKYTRAFYIRDALKKLTFYNSIITESQNYFKIIGMLNKKILKEENRRVINIISTTDEKNPNSQSSKLLKILEKYKPDKLYGKLNEVNDNTRIILAGYKKSHKGFSFEPLTDAILCFPMTNENSLEQSIGRILRTSIGKPTPRVWVLVDNGFNGYYASKVNKQKQLFKNLYGDNLIIKEAFLTDI